MRSMQEILTLAGYDCYSYEGRGMAGTECLAVECDSAFKLFSDVVEVLEGSHPSEFTLVAQAFRGAREDSLGRNKVVYFPRIRHTR